MRPPACMADSDLDALADGPSWILKLKLDDSGPHKVRVLGLMPLCVSRNILFEDLREFVAQLKELGPV